MWYYRIVSKEMVASHGASMQVSFRNLRRIGFWGRLGAFAGHKQFVRIPMGFGLRIR